MKKILYIQTAFPGDAILSLPAIEKLKELNPDSSVDILCIPLTAEIFDASPFVNEVLVFEKRGKHKSISGLLKFARELRNRKYDVIYSSHRSFRTSILVLLSEVRETYGFSNSSIKYVYKNIVTYELNKHEVQRNFDLIGYSYDKATWRVQPKINFSDDVRVKVENFLNEFKTDKMIAVAPGSLWATKRYPKEKWQQIVDYFSSKNFTILLIGGKDDESLCQSILASASGKVYNTAGKFSIVESIKLLTHCSLLISNDSAPTHFGMCAEIKVLTIYCSTIPQFGFYPYMFGSKLISFDELSCKPCGIHGHRKCPLNHFNCANQLSENEIIKVAEEMLNE
ncbi:glycosyltransferase family 9 protein [Ignavibacterium sp.]|uniref:glycosyltransferase family 9 protein n=1 Tax=Ignavibacterium sp. TaxID=2651167 RepID=UPI00307F44FE